MPEVNSLGLALLNADQDCCDLDAAFAASSAARPTPWWCSRTICIAAPDRARVDAVLAQAKLIVLDHQSHATAAKADVVLAAGSFAESDGTVVSARGPRPALLQGL